MITTAVRYRILEASEGAERLNVIREWCASRCGGSHRRISINDARAVLGWCGSFETARALELLSKRMHRDDRWPLFGEHWTRCDDGVFILRFLEWQFSTAALGRFALAMNDTERTTLAALPETFPVWRGCYAYNRTGLSWSLSRDVAAGFPFLHRYAQPNRVPLLMEGVATRDRCVLKLDRGEQEILAARITFVSESEMDPPTTGGHHE